MKRFITFILSAGLLLSVFSVFSVCSAAGETYDTSWYKQSEPILYLNDKEDFLGFGYLLASQNKTFSGQTIELLCDVTINDVDLSADDLQTDSLIAWYNTIGGKNFAGTFDGNGHTVSGLYYPSTQDYMGIFGKPQGTSACVRDLSIVNSLLVSEKAKYVGSIFGQIYTTQPATLENLYIDVTIRCGTSNANMGGLIGRSQSALLQMNSCVFAGTISASSATALGGLIGMANHGSFSVSDCAAYGTLNGSTGAVGGLMGTADVAGTVCCSVADVAISSSAGKQGVLYGSTSATVTLQNNLYVAHDMSPVPGSAAAESVNGQYKAMASSRLRGLDAMLTLAQFELTHWKADRNGYALPSTVASMRLSDTNTDVPEVFGTKLVGYQLSHNITDTFSLRIIGVVDSLSYEAVGLSVYAQGEDQRIGTKQEDRRFTEVYREIIGYGSDDTRVNYTAADLGGSFIFALNINNIPVRCGVIRFTLQSYHVLAGKSITDGQETVFELDTDTLGTQTEVVQ